MRITRRGFLALAATVRARAAALGRFPYVQNVRADRASVLWTTNDEPGEGIVEYSSDLSFGRMAAARVSEYLPAQTGLPRPFYQYEAELFPLRPGVEYNYRVNVDGLRLTPSHATFRTAGPGPFSFVAIGDSGTGGDAQRSVLRRMTEESQPPAFVMHTGDLAYPNGTFAEFERNYFEIYRDLMQRVCFFPTAGNHEYYSDNAFPYLATHSVPIEGVPRLDQRRYYSFDWGNAHFVSIDSNLADRPLMLEWLDRDLARTRQFWKIAFFHHPPFSVGKHHGADALIRVRNYILPILERRHVQIAFTGHEHNYQRLKPIVNGEPHPDRYSGPHVVITGGGGGDLFEIDPQSPYVESAHRAYHCVWVDVEGGRLRLRAKAVEPDRDLETVEWAPPPVITSGGVVNATDYSSQIYPGGAVTIFGRQLAPEDLRAGFPLPTSLGGVEVQVNDRPLPLLFASPTQVNARLPFDLSGRVAVRVVTPAGASEAEIEISSAISTTL